MLIVVLIEEWRWEEKRRVYLLKFDSIDEPNPTHVESSDQGKAYPDLFKPTQWFSAKIMPLRRHMGRVSVRTNP